MWIKSIFEDGVNHSISSRRIITFLSFLLCAIAFIADLFWSLTVSEFMYENMVYLTMAGLGFVIAEKFSRNKD